MSFSIVKTSPSPSHDSPSPKKSSSGKVKGKRSKLRSKRPKGYFVRAAKYRAALDVNVVGQEDDLSASPAPPDDTPADVGPSATDAHDGGDEASHVEHRPSQHDVSDGGSSHEASGDEERADQGRPDATKDRQDAPKDRQEVTKDAPADPTLAAKQVSPGGPATQFQVSTPIGGQALPGLHTPQNVSGFPANDGGEDY